MPTGRLSHEQVDVLRGGDAKARVSHEQVDVLRSGDAKGRLSQMQVDVLRMGASSGRLSHLQIDVLVSISTVSVADSFSFSDSVTTSLDVSSTPSITFTTADSFSFSDAVATSLDADPGLIQFSWSDSLELVEGSGQDTENRFWERLLFDDSIMAGETFTSSSADTLAFTDGLEQIMAIAFSWEERLDFGESLGATMEQTSQVADQLAFVDEVATQLIVVGITVSVAETLSFSDSVTIQSGFPAQFADNLVFSDTLKSSFFSGLTTGDAFAFSDSFEMALGTLPIFVDTLAFDDSVTTLLATELTLNVSDWLQFTGDSVKGRKAGSDVAYLRRYLNDVL